MYGNVYLRVIVKYKNVWLVHRLTLRLAFKKYLIEKRRQATKDTNIGRVLLIENKTQTYFSYVKRLI